MVRLLIATHNAGKRREYEQLLAGLPPTVRLCSLRDLNPSPNVDENGTSYAENARMKARACAQALSLLTLADDSGLEVDALQGEPGIHSARYGGHSLSDADRYGLLLARLLGVPWSRRRARFRCVVALASPTCDIQTAEGACEGIIAFKPAGEHGFGYDPVFYLPERDCTMAELTPEVKNRIGHRARAVRAILPTLLATLAGTALPAGVRDG